jgi:hypothetical protein
MKIKFEYSPEELKQMEETMNAFAEAGDEFSEMAAAGIAILKGQGEFAQQSSKVMMIKGHIGEDGASVIYNLEESAFCAGMHTAAAFAETWAETIEYLKALAVVLQAKRVIGNFKSMFTAVKKSFNGEDPAIKEDEEEA